MVLDGGSGPELNSEPNDSLANNDRLAKHLTSMCASSLFTGLSKPECMEVLSSGEVRTFVATNSSSLRSIHE